MTCIVGIVHKGTIYMGADSATTSGYSSSILSRSKIFLKENKFLIGGTGSCRLCQLLEYKLKIPKKKNTQSNMEYLVTDFTDSVRELFIKNNFDDKDHNLDINFLLGYESHLYYIYGDLQIEETLLNFSAAGCGKDLALGSLFSTSSLKLSPEQRIYFALAAAAKFNCAVARPFNLLTLK